MAERAHGSYSMPVGQALHMGLAAAIRNLIPFSVLSLVVYAPWIGVLLLAAATPQGERVAAVWTLLIVLLPYVLNNVVTGALSYGVVQQLRGKPAGLGDCLVRGFADLLRVLLTGMLAGVRILLGFMLLFVPGVIESCRLWVALPAAVLERASPVQAIKRSIALTAGSRRSIFGVNFIIGLVSLGLGKLQEIVTKGMHGWTPVIVSVAITVLLGVWGACSGAVGYYLLRKGKENVDVAELAKVFG